MESAYEGDSSESGQLKLQEIRKSIADAEEELAETEFERYLSSQEQLLDELVQEYELTINARLDNLDNLVSGVIDSVNADSALISETLREISNEVGYTLSSTMQSTWNSSTASINGVISEYGNNFTNLQTSTNTSLNAIKSNLDSIVNHLNATAKTNVKSASSSSAANSNKNNTSSKPSSTTNKKEDNKTNSSTSSSSGSGQIKVGGKINAGNAQIYDFAGDTSGERQLFRDDPIYTVLDERNGYLLTRHHKLSSGYTGWFKKSDVKAYASGKKNLLDNDIAWTQEEGREFIVRPSDGAILTPLAKKDSVLNANASNNIWNMANNPAEFIKDNLNLGDTSIPSNANIQSNYTQNIDNVVFRMDNIKNYDEMLASLQKDKNFERLILSMSIDRLAGKSSLAKGKAIR